MHARLHAWVVPSIRGIIFLFLDQRSSFYVHQLFLSFFVLPSFIRSSPPSLPSLRPFPPFFHSSSFIELTLSLSPHPPILFLSTIPPPSLPPSKIDRTNVTPPVLASPARLGLFASLALSYPRVSTPPLSYPFLRPQLFLRRHPRLGTGHASYPDRPRNTPPSI